MVASHVLLVVVASALGERTGVGATHNTTMCDVLVLGGGLAGTSAAWRLVGERPAGTPKPH
eukprot:5567063-Prymnesium_polylepis.1